MAARGYMSVYIIDSFFYFILVCLFLYKWRQRSRSKWTTTVRTGKSDSGSEMSLTTLSRTSRVSASAMTPHPFRVPSEATHYPWRKQTLFVSPQTPARSKNKSIQNNKIAYVGYDMIGPLRYLPWEDCFKFEWNISKLSNTTHVSLLNLYTCRFSKLRNHWCQMLLGNIIILLQSLLVLTFLPASDWLSICNKICSTKDVSIIVRSGGSQARGSLYEGMFPGEDTTSQTAMVETLFNNKK